jgi:hypothetical protein
MNVEAPKDEQKREVKKAHQFDRADAEHVRILPAGKRGREWRTIVVGGVFSTSRLALPRKAAGCLNDNGM